LEGDLKITKWEYFKNLINPIFYPIGFVEDQWICGHYFRQRQGQSVQEHTTKFRKVVIMLGISPKNLDALLKYLGVIHSHLQKKVIFFEPRILYEAYVQEKYLEKMGHKKDIQVVPNGKSTKTLPRRERRSGNGKTIR
jgi:hypothetical protein